MLYRDPSPAKLKKARIKTIEKELKTMLEEEFLQRRTFHDTYSPYMSEKILQVGERGGGRSQMMKEIGVRTVNTFRKWLEDNQDFADAYELAQVYCQAYLEELALQKSTGENQDVDIKAISMLMSARFPEYKKETNNKTEINITNNQLERLTDEELNARLQQGYTKLGYRAPITIEGVIIEHVPENQNTTD